MPASYASAQDLSSSLSAARRINVTGNAGSGKSTSARLLGRRLGLPVYSLDSLVWQPGWRKTPRADREANELRLIHQAAWIIDGVSKTVRDAADLVIVLDTPSHICLARASIRTIRHMRRQREEFPTGCPEWRIYPYLVRTILGFSSKAGLDIRKEAEQDSRYCVIANAEALFKLSDATSF